MRAGLPFIAAALLLIAPDAATAAPYSARQTQELLSRAAIEQLNADYIYDLDHDQSDKLAGMFEPDGVLYFADNDVRLTGRHAIADYYAHRTRTRTTRHASTNLRLTFTDADHAHGTRYLIYFAGDGAPPFPGASRSMLEYEESYTRGGDGQWRYATRTARGIFGPVAYTKQQQTGGAPK